MYLQQRQSKNINASYQGNSCGWKLIYNTIIMDNNSDEEMDIKSKNITQEKIISYNLE